MSKLIKEDLSRVTNIFPKSLAKVGDFVHVGSGKEPERVIKIERLEAPYSSKLFPNTVITQRVETVNHYYNR